MLPLPRRRTELEWQHEQLSADQLAWLARLPTYTQHRDISLWHGSAIDSVTGWISGAADAANHLTQQQTRVGLVGHTHRTMIASLGDGAIHYDDSPCREDLTGRGRVVLNPGAVTHTQRWLELDVDAELATWHVE